MIRNIKCLHYTILLYGLIIPAVIHAHHGVGAQFDLSQVIELEGEVKKLIWRNPHIRITLGVTNGNGNEELWVVEAQSVSMLRQRDITKQLFTLGDKLLLAGNPARNGDTEIYATNALLPDGRELTFSQNAEPRWKDNVLGKTGARFATSGDTSRPELGLFRTWSAASDTGLVEHGFDFDTHPLTDSARAMGESYNRLTDNLSTGECAEKGMPAIVSNPYPFEFVDQGDVILIRMEENDTVRTINMTSARTQAASSSRLGYSVGQWENKTLKVTTTGVSSNTFVRGIPLSEEVKIIEHFTPSTDGSRLDYHINITDPEVFLEPVDIDYYWIYLPEVSVETYGCLDGEVK